jgi:hypothetical protein
MECWAARMASAHHPCLEPAVPRKPGCVSADLRTHSRAGDDIRSSGQHPHFSSRVCSFEFLLRTVARKFFAAEPRGRCHSPRMASSWEKPLLDLPRAIARHVRSGSANANLRRSGDPTQRPQWVFGLSGKLAGLNPE